jgi:hypothetical protein
MVPVASSAPSLQNPLNTMGCNHLPAGELPPPTARRVHGEEALRKPPFPQVWGWWTRQPKPRAKTSTFSGEPASPPPGMAARPGPTHMFSHDHRGGCGPTRHVGWLRKQLDAVSSVIADAQTLPCVRSHPPICNDALLSLERGDGSPGFGTKDSVLFKRRCGDMFLIQHALQQLHLIRPRPFLQ